MRGKLILTMFVWSISFISTQLGIASNRQISHNRGIVAQAVRIYFPASKRDIMLKVAGCETGQTWYPLAYNSSGASGEFQIMRSHNGSTFTYDGISITVDSTRLFDPYYNTLVAYVMSQGGQNLDPWYSSESCWD